MDPIFLTIDEVLEIHDHQIKAYLVIQTYAI